MVDSKSAQFDDGAIAAIRAVLTARGTLALRADRRALHVATHAEESIRDLLTLASEHHISIRTRSGPLDRRWPFRGDGDQEPLAADERTIYLDVRPWDGIVEHAVDDFVVRARAGMSVAKLQERLALHRQWLPLDPPLAGELTIGEAVSRNEFGPYRTLHGGIREHLIGARFVPMGGGVTLKTGGIVVKAATGFDLHRLQVGALETLAIGVEFTFRLKPLPDGARTLELECPSRSEAYERALALRERAMAPAVLFVFETPQKPPRVVVRYEGPEEALADAAAGAARELGMSEVSPDAAAQWLAIAREEWLRRNGGEKRCAIRITCRPSRLEKVTHEVAHQLQELGAPPSCVAHPGVAFADLWCAAEPGDSKEWLQRLRARVAACGGGTVRMRLPIDLLGDSSGSLDARLKAVADPRMLLNPHQCP